MTRARTDHGFTLVELLVVIGIIAMLISILLPSLNKARIAARTVACASNMRSLGQLFAIYQANSKGNFPPAMYYAGGSAPWYGTAWPSRISPKAAVSDNAADAFSANVANPGALLCPLFSDSDLTAPAPLTRSYVLSGMTYYAPASFRNPGGKNNTVFGDRSQQLNGLPATFQLRNPAKIKADSTVMLMEVRPRSEPWSNARAFSAGGEPWGTMDFYDWSYLYGPWAHNFKNANYLFADGHVATVTPPIKYSANPNWYGLMTINSGSFGRMFSVDKTRLPMDAVP